MFGHIYCSTRKQLSEEMQLDVNDHLQSNSELIKTTLCVLHMLCPNKQTVFQSYVDNTSEYSQN
jgi:hypothetical protein